MMYSEFEDLENATIVIKTLGEATLNEDYQPVYTSTEIYNGVGIYYELSASEKVARTQIQKAATGQIILNPNLVTTKITEDMEVYITSELLTESQFRIVTVKNPLGTNEAILIDVIED